MGAIDMLDAAAPAPFEIVTAEGVRTASNGQASLTVFEPEAELFKRRAIKGINVKPAGEAAIPLLNQLAGELLAEPGMAAHLVAERIRGIAEQVVPVPPQRVEWAVAVLDGVRVYFDGLRVIVTRADLQP